jgi:hypothetical protein
LADGAVVAWAQHPNRDVLVLGLDLDGLGIGLGLLQVHGLLGRLLQGVAATATGLRLIDVLRRVVVVGGLGVGVGVVLLRHVAVIARAQHSDVDVGVARVVLRGIRVGFRRLDRPGELSRRLA